MARRTRDPALLQQFGKRLHAARDAGKITQQRLADAIGVRPATVSLFECGGLSPTLTTAAALAEALHVRLADLVDFEGPLPGPEPRTAEEIELLEGFREISDDHRVLVVNLVRGLNGSGKRDGSRPDSDVQGGEDA